MRWLYFWHIIMRVQLQMAQGINLKTHTSIRCARTCSPREAVPIRATDKFWNLKLRRWGKWEIEFQCVYRACEITLHRKLVQSWLWDAAWKMRRRKCLRFVRLCGAPGVLQFFVDTQTARWPRICSLFVYIKWGTAQMWLIVSGNRGALSVSLKASNEILINLSSLLGLFQSKK